MEKLVYNEIKAGEEEFDFDLAYKNCFVDITTPFPPPPIALGIGEHDYMNQNYLNPI